MVRIQFWEVRSSPSLPLVTDPLWSRVVVSVSSFIELFNHLQRIGLVSRVFTKSYQRLLKWYLIPPCLTLHNIRYISRVKWSNPEKGVAPSPTPQFSSYWKGSLLVTLDYNRQLYFIIIGHLKSYSRVQIVCIT